MTRISTRVAWAAAVMAMGGCTALLGIDGDYRPVGSSTTPGGGGGEGGGTTATATTGGGSAPSSGGVGAGGESSTGTTSSASSSSSASSTGSGVPCFSDGGPCDCDDDKALATSCAMGTDCNDHNPLVYPGQKRFFKDKIDGSVNDYDYDCNGKEDSEVTLVINCVALNCNTTAVGWKTAVPPCGASGQFGTCKVSGLACMEIIQGMQVQRCH